ncbi:ethanolamine ammonia-lyase subunit EutC [Bosea sp. (in: a-proteobacteria)]|uniref:ethanolamine ammonia-lyase subunit EutC n=1 Tax=Bosea sp. (in: a-proteobacteria) TaxID=1871050 RepID=UPI0027344C72|nr:ethanolamine ammonia-lyase subunit EutC [Bosea sp. (in: a-proteobacteria)]MDP3254689.1 ethanolamine ammonia-lyase subunit EutC [Bosea sp. (in: a-proteobacteria)]
MNGSEKPPAAGRFAELARLTPARIALGRSGVSLPMHEVLRFGLAHAQARDAVHAPFRPDDVATALAGLGLETLAVASAARSREDYLRRPDWGRSLSPESLTAVEARQGRFDLALVVADGLSSTAVHQNAAPLVEALLPHLRRQSLSLAPVVIASQARVALGDAAGQALGAGMVLVMIGERPGLSSPDSLGAYLTFAPRTGLTDEARNCISNIRPGGMGFAEAAFRLAWLIDQGFRRSLTGVGLKDESDAALEAGGAGGLIPEG